MEHTDLNLVKKMFNYFLWVAQLEASPKAVKHVPVKKITGKLILSELVPAGRVSPLFHTVFMARFFVLFHLHLYASSGVKP